MEESENIQQNQVKIEVKQGGPYIVTGTILIADKDGTEKVKEGKSALCRCGASANKPFCDGSHNKVEFEK